MNWSPLHEAALKAVADWLHNGDKPWFYLAGFAGSGKTTLANSFASGLGGNVLFGAYTGKAAYVLRQKGCQGATTIHSLIYQPKEKNKERLMELRQEVENVESALRDAQIPPEQWCNDAQWKRATEEFEIEQQGHKRMSFQLNSESPVRDASLLIIDECSMVDQQIGNDLLSYETPILVLGDPAQLPPVFGTGFFTGEEPDFLLTEIHRQARDNPILRMAHDVREGRGLRPGQYGESKVISRDQVDKDEVLTYDQILVGSNKLRRSTNVRMRQLLGRGTDLPEGGDRLVCLRNDKESQLLNGGIWKVNDSIQSDDNTVELDITSEDGTQSVVASSHTEYFKGGEPYHWTIRDKQCFDYGYALTTHKAQGSQWDRCYIFDESRIFRQDARKWLYTALTRAAKVATVAV